MMPWHEPASPRGHQARPNTHTQAGSHSALSKKGSCHLPVHRATLTKEVPFSLPETHSQCKELYFHKMDGRVRAAPHN